jgi:D-lactate dehydrogenase
VIIEDVAFPIERLADAAVDLTKLFHRHGYDEGIIFGHAKDGNLHFVITQGFSEQREVDRYARFIDELVEMVVRRYDGALKAEHGTGRNMAPFVETEWGGEALQIMRRLKRLCDPWGLLNPGVILPEGPRAHLDHLKALPSVEAEVDKCIECGFCEPRCPSRELTLTPRQRIVVRREMARLQRGAQGPVPLAELAADAPYMVLDTCAVDGLCATACPVGIDTGLLTKRLRHEAHSPADEARGLGFAEDLERVEGLLHMGLRLGNTARAMVGDRAMAAVTRAARFASGVALPIWTKDMPRAAPWLLPRTDERRARAIYFPSCLSRTMGHLPGEPGRQSLIEAMIAVSARAGVPLHIPADVQGTCCGVPFSSKGYVDGHRVAANAAIERLWRWSDGGALPVVVDTSPCTYGLLHADAVLSDQNKERARKMRILDGVQFAHDELLPRLTVLRKARSVALHPVCSLVKMDLTGKLEAVARACSESVTVPSDAGCCGFAGDRGFLVPELTASATRAEAAQVKEHHHDGCYSSSRTCEIGMTSATGQNYRSFVYLLEEATRP